MESGDNWERANVRAWITLTTLLVRQGNVSFTYRVDAERNYDGLRFYVDGVQSRLGLVSVQPDWRTYTVRTTDTQTTNHLTCVMCVCVRLLGACGTRLSSVPLGL